MCGIVAYIGHNEKEIKNVLLDSLSRLEYRGYDSAGITILDQDKFVIKKAVGKLSELVNVTADLSLNSNIGIGHTRWATHGVPSNENCHPHLSHDGRIALVHNGIFENYIELREQLSKAGFHFESETDTETLGHLIQQEYTGDFLAAVQAALKQIEGTYSICVMHSDHPDVLIAARNQSPLIIGMGEKENYVASDVPAILPYTKKVIYLDDGQIAVIKADAVSIVDGEGEIVDYAVEAIEWDLSAAEKGGYDHFMLKEIFEQPESLTATLNSTLRKDGSLAGLSEECQSPEFAKSINRVIFVACGTAWHAGLAAKYMFEQYAKIPSEAVMASEFRYGDPIIDSQTLVVCITQSGETADTLAGLRKAKSMGAIVFSICNAVGSTIPRESDEVLYMRCGPEIGVASTKAYTSMLLTLSLLALHLGHLRGVVSVGQQAALVSEMKTLPDKVAQILDNAKEIKQVAETYVSYQDFMFIGRRYNYPTACEAALKLKEISYLHAEGYAGGEMKHGPIALIDERFPTVAIVTKSPTYVKMISNIRELKARSGIIIAIATTGDRDIEALADSIVFVPDCSEIFSPILSVVPLQLFAYHIATMNDKDVDQPRNLAKSVTVE